MSNVIPFRRKPAGDAAPSDDKPAWGFLALLAVGFGIMEAIKLSSGTYRETVRLPRYNPTEPKIHKLYRAWVAADDAFGDALRRVYGKRAGDMRYRPGLWSDHPEISAAWVRVQRANHEYLEATRAR